MSREDHRRYDKALEKLRTEAKAAVEASSPQRKRRERQDRALTIVLALVAFALTLFLKVWWAGISLFVGLFFLADWIGNLEGMIEVRKSKTRGIQAAIIILGVIGEFIVLYPFWRKEQAVALEGKIHARNPRKLKHPVVQLGTLDDIGVIQWTPEGTTVNLLRDAGVSFEMGVDGIEISTTVRDRYGHRIAQLTKNQWTVEPPPASVDKNYTDDTLEVQDGGGHVVLQVRLLSDRAQLRGEWHNEFGGGAQITECKRSDGTLFPCVQEFGTNLPEQTNKMEIEPLFEYPSKDHWGEFRKKK